MWAMTRNLELMKQILEAICCAMQESHWVMFVCIIVAVVVKPYMGPARYHVRVLLSHRQIA